MNRLIFLHNFIFSKIEQLFGPWLLPTLSRFVFAAVLFYYFWQAGVSKIDWGAGVFGFLQPTDGGFAQIFPKQAEAVFWDLSQLSFFQHIVIVGGGYAEMILPLLVVIGLVTRLAAIGMVGFVIIQSLTDLYGHGGIQHAQTLGAWFDRLADGAILDQRAFWMLVLTVLIVRGAGPISVDALLRGISGRGKLAEASA